MTKSTEKRVTTTENNVEANGEKCHLMSHLMSSERDRGQEINDLVCALRKIGYFESFRVKENGQLSADKWTKGTMGTERKARRRAKARYRRIQKYYKSIKQYKKERLRRKLCWLLSGKYKQTEIAEMLGVSRRTVIRDMNKIKPYYSRISRSYLSKLDQERIKEFNAQLKGKTLKQQFDILTKAIVAQKKLRRQSEYNRHVHKILIDLDHIQYDGFPRITHWPHYSNNMTMPIILQLICIKEGQKHKMGSVQFSYVRTRSWF